MNKNKIKAFAPVARKELIAAVTAKAQMLGLSEAKIEPLEIKGDVALIAGRPFPRSIVSPRRNLESAIKKEGFSQLMERIAFTWFNRFSGLRFMELHNYFEHGYRILSHRATEAQRTSDENKNNSSVSPCLSGNFGVPEILEHCTEIDLPGLNKAKVSELRLAGNKDAELYRLLLVGQCNALSTALPFLFEKTNDETELLLPDNLLHTDSPIRKLVSEIDEADWSDVEIIGWLYQFYISEKKDSVIGKVVKSEDIPAATQLFTPNWIVKYLVQNTLGRQWLATYPNSGLKEKMEFYITPAEQVARDEGLGTRKGENDGGKKLSGSDRLAEGDGLSGTDLSDYQKVSQGRNLCTDQSTSKSCGINSIEHSRRSCEKIDGGVQKLSFDSPGIISGSGDSTSSGNPLHLPDSTRNKIGTGVGYGDLQNASRTSIQTKQQGLEVRDQGLASPSSLDPELITFFDPACGSGHILVEAYDLFKEIYLERGYRTRDIPRLILEKNLFGLDIDERAAQLSCFALMMKARADDRGILSSNPPASPQVLAIQESKGLDFEEIAQGLEKGTRDKGLGSSPQPLASIPSSVVALLKVFENAKTFGSLIRVPDELIKILPTIERLVDSNVGRDLPGMVSANVLRPLARQAGILSKQYDHVVANPPYMGMKGMNSDLKDFAKKHFPSTKSDLFAMFIERGFGYAKPETGFNSMVTMQSWMFLSSFEEFRTRILCERTLQCMVHMGNGVMGIAFGTAATIFLNKHIDDFFGNFSFCEIDDICKTGAPKEFPVQNDRLKTTKLDDFKKIPGSPVAYWISNAFVNIFTKGQTLEEVATPRQGLSTSNNDLFLRQWFEVCYEKIEFNANDRSDAIASGKRWFPYSKGGVARRWYGNHDYVINWEADGRDVKEFLKDKNPNVARGESHYFKPAVCWSLITSSAKFGFAARNRPRGFIFDINGMSSFPSQIDFVTALMNSRVTDSLLKIINPTMAFQVGDIKQIRSIFHSNADKCSDIARKAVEITKEDWDNFETSWDFFSFPWLPSEKKIAQIKLSWAGWSDSCRKRIHSLKEFDEENNRLFIEAYGLQDEMTIAMPEGQITLTANPRYRYGEGFTEEEYQTRFRYDSTKELLSYAVGCMMGRYSLDAPGLILANSESTLDDYYRVVAEKKQRPEGFRDQGVKAGTRDQGLEPSGGEKTSPQPRAPSPSFPPDDDGIVPVSDIDWFPDDATPRLVEFITKVFGTETLDENLAWIAEGISHRDTETRRNNVNIKEVQEEDSPKKSSVPLCLRGNPVEVIRRYFSTKFFKDHMQMYRKRPIYWLFSSGKQKAFEALVYLHRYNESTLSRMRAQYVTPLQGKLNARIEYLKKEAENASSASAKTKFRKEAEALTKKQAELAKFDEELRHYSDLRIKLDLDEGVRVNYGKFGTLLAETKHITGGDEE